MTVNHTLIMTEPAHYEVTYVINPWMRPARWGRNEQRLKAEALLRWRQMYNSLQRYGAQVRLMPAVAGLPDLVFAANGAVVLDGRVLLARFAHPQRRQEEPVFRHYFETLAESGAVDVVASLPERLYQEGAGDCLWDSHRELFWFGFGQRSVSAAGDEIARFFRCDVVALELIDPRFYHLDVALAVLENGELVYFPGAFSPSSLDRIRALVPADKRIEVDRCDAAHFNVNLISLLGVIFTTHTSDLLKANLTARGYRLCELDLSPFLLSGGAAACLSLRLDYRRTETTAKLREVHSDSCP